MSEAQKIACHLQGMIQTRMSLMINPNVYFELSIERQLS